MKQLLLIGLFGFLSSSLCAQDAHYCDSLPGCFTIIGIGENPFFDGSQIVNVEIENKWNGLKRFRSDVKENNPIQLFIPKTGRTTNFKVPKETSFNRVELNIGQGGKGATLRQVKIVGVEETSNYTTLRVKYKKVE